MSTFDSLRAHYAAEDARISVDMKSEKKSALSGGPAAGAPVWVDKQCHDTEWFTPPEVLERVRQYFGGPIPFDPATTANNPTDAIRFCSLEEPCDHARWLGDGLEHDWYHEAGVFLNPPYGVVFPTWCEKIAREARLQCEIVALLPCGARFSTRYWQDSILIPELDAVCFVRGRVKFLRADGARAPQNPYDSQMVGYNVRRKAFADAFSSLGRVLLTTVIEENRSRS